MTDVSAPDDTSAGRVRCGALPDDITVAVEILSVAHQIPGSSAYMVMSQVARHSHLTIRQTARMVVRQDPAWHVSAADLEMCTHQA